MTTNQLSLDKQAKRAAKRLLLEGYLTSEQVAPGIVDYLRQMKEPVPVYEVKIQISSSKEIIIYSCCNFNEPEHDGCVDTIKNIEALYGELNYKGACT